LERLRTQSSNSYYKAKWDREADRRAADGQHTASARMLIVEINLGKEAEYSGDEGRTVAILGLGDFVNLAVEHTRQAHQNF